MYFSNAIDPCRSSDVGAAGKGRSVCVGNSGGGGSVCWMRSPLCLCRHAWSSLVNVDKLSILRKLVDFLTSLAPLTTLIIILLLSYYSYQVFITYTLTMQWLGKHP